MYQQDLSKGQSSRSRTEEMPEQQASGLRQDPLIGTLFAGRFRIISVLGIGGMGVVYKALHEIMDKYVAVKMLHPQLVSDELSVARFKREAQSAARLNHKHVISLYDSGISDSGEAYIVMDLLNGVSLADVIKQEGRLGVNRCISIVAQACDALEHAHSKGIIHRDLKPGNIMLTQTEEEHDFVKVVDFGVAKFASGEESQRLTRTGEVFGSPVYMSPEQCRGEELDPRSDIYAMGVVLYEALTGQLPFLGKTIVETVTKHLSADPPPFSQVAPELYIPPRLEAVVRKALSKNKVDRQQSMEELRAELERAVPPPASRGVSALRTLTPSFTDVPPPKARPGFSLLAAAVVGALVAAGGVSCLFFANMLMSKSSCPATSSVPNPARRVLPKNPQASLPQPARPKTKPVHPPVVADHTKVWPAIDKTEEETKRPRTPERAVRPIRTVATILRTAVASTRKKRRQHDNAEAIATPPPASHEPTPEYVPHRSLADDPNGWYARRDLTGH